MGFGIGIFAYRVFERSEFKIFTENFRNVPFVKEKSPTNDRRIKIRYNLNVEKAKN